VTKSIPEKKLRLTFAANVRAARRDQRISQEELGAKAGLDRTYVSSMERGQRNVSIDNIEKVAAALGVDASELLRSYMGVHK
jgi:transcriptional regulator with XRE-family HTH domain